MFKKRLFLVFLISILFQIVHNSHKKCSKLNLKNDKNSCTPNINFSITTLKLHFKI